MTWYRTTDTAYGNISDVYYTVRDADGAPLAPVTKFTNDTAGVYEMHDDPNLAKLPGGHVLLTWECHSSYMYNRDICYAVLDDAGNTVKGMTNAGFTSGAGYNADAVALSTGNVVIAWHEWRRDRYCIAYTVLDRDYNVIPHAPTIFPNPAAVTGDDYISVAADGNGHAILTWTDADASHRHNLYYALVNYYGKFITYPMIFRTSQAAEPFITTSFAGHGNTSNSWTPALSVDGFAAFGTTLVIGPPAGNVALNVRYANHGAKTATGVVLTATMPGGVTYVDDTLGVVPTASGDNVVWGIPDLGFLDSRSFALQVQLPPGTGTAFGVRYPMTLTLSSDGPEANTYDNVDRAEVMMTFARPVFLPVVSRVY